MTREQNDGALAAAISKIKSYNNIDWPKFIALAEHHQVEGLIGAALSAYKSAEVPDTVRGHFGKQAKQQCLQSLVMNSATIEVANALSSAGIASVVLKGHAISARYYDVAGARQCVDIDILVEKTKAVRARSIVKELGFKQCFPYCAVPSAFEDILQDLVGEEAYRRTKDGVSVDLHWQISSNPQLLNWQFDTIRGFTTSVPIGGMEVSVLKTPAQLLYLFCHGANHAWYRLKWLADIYRVYKILTDEQANQVVQIARSNGTMRMIATSLRLLEIVYNVPIEKFPEKQLRQHENKYLLRHMLKCIEDPVSRDSIRLKDLGTLFRDYRYQLRLRSDMAHKSSVLWRGLADVRDIRTIRLSKKWLWLYVLVGPWLKVIRLCNRELEALRLSG